jgi:hypothetical protein
VNGFADSLMEYFFIFFANRLSRTQKVHKSYKNTGKGMRLENRKFNISILNPMQLYSLKGESENTMPPLQKSLASIQKI